MKFLCFLGLHEWIEYEIDFFNPRHVQEICLVCEKRRERIDETKQKSRFNWM